MLLSAGFVLGEGCGLLGTVAPRMMAGILLAGGFGAFSCFLGMWDLKKGKAGRRFRTGKKALTHGKDRKFFWPFLFLVFLWAGYARGRQAEADCRRELELGLDGKRVEVSGTVLSIRKKGESFLLVLGDCAVFSPGRGKGLGSLGRVQVYVDAKEGSRPRAGGKLWVEGQASAYQRARNPGEFDYQLYYRSLKMNYRIFGDQWEGMGGRYGWYRDGLYELSAYAGHILEQVAGPEDAGIFQAAILGEKSGMDEEIRNLYQKSGISHLLAISGLHLSLASAAAYKGLRRLGLGYGKAGILGGFFLLSFAVMCGAPPSALRALVMVLCGFLAAYLGRAYDLLSALGLAALLLLWDSPYRLFQSGVQLSFGAAAGIGGLGPELVRGFEGQGSAGPVRKTLIVSFAMQMMTLPVVLYHFFQVPLYGLFLNLLVVPLMGIVIASGAAGVFLGSFCLPLGRFAVGSGRCVLRGYESLCRLWGMLPGSSQILGRPRMGQAVAFYGLLAVAVWMCRKGRKRLSALTLVLSAAALLPVPLRGMEVTFLDVGQGDGICIRTRQGTILVDAGSSDQKKLGEGRLEPFLKSKGVRSVEYAIVSHGDEDHVSGLTWLMEHGDIPIKNLILPEVGKGEEPYCRLEALAKGQGGDVSWMKRGDQILAGRLKVHCLYPEEEALPGEGRNGHSLVLQVDYGGCHLLLTGDMGSGGEERLLDLEKRENGGFGGIGKVQVLKVAHHGSRYSTGPKWLDAVGPAWAVVSYGEENRYGHPGQEVMERLEDRHITVYETGKGGAVTLRTDGKGLWWDQWMDGR